MEGCTGGVRNTRVKKVLGITPSDTQQSCCSIDSKGHQSEHEPSLLALQPDAFDGTCHIMLLQA